MPEVTVLDASLESASYTVDIAESESSAAIDSPNYSSELSSAELPAP